MERTGFMPTKSISVKKVKGLPKRASQPQHKTRRQACWARGERRKDARRLAQAERQRENNKLRSERNPYTKVADLPMSVLTPWEMSKRTRRLRRAARFNKAVVTVEPKAS